MVLVALDIVLSGHPWTDDGSVESALVTIVRAVVATTGEITDLHGMVTAVRGVIMAAPVDLPDDELVARVGFDSRAANIEQRLPSSLRAARQRGCLPDDLWELGCDLIGWDRRLDWSDQPHRAARRRT